MLKIKPVQVGLCNNSKNNNNNNNNNNIFNRHNKLIKAINTKQYLYIIMLYTIVVQYIQTSNSWLCLWGFFWWKLVLSISNWLIITDYTKSERTHTCIVKVGARLICITAAYHAVGVHLLVGHKQTRVDILYVPAETLTLQSDAKSPPASDVASTGCLQTIDIHYMDCWHCSSRNILRHRVALPSYVFNIVRV